MRACHPSKPTEVYDIVADIASTSDLAPARPDLMKEFERIFQAARFDSEWYVNPDETPQQIAAKTRRARDAGSMVQLVGPNASSK